MRAEVDGEHWEFNELTNSYYDDDGLYLSGRLYKPKSDEDPVLYTGSLVFALQIAFQGDSLLNTNLGDIQDIIAEDSSSRLRYVRFRETEGQSVISNYTVNTVSFKFDVQTFDIKDKILEAIFSSEFILGYSNDNHFRADTIQITNGFVRTRLLHRDNLIQQTETFDGYAEFCKDASEYHGVFGSFEFGDTLHTQNDF